MKFNKNLFIIIVFCCVGLSLPSLSESDLPEIPKNDLPINELEVEQTDTTILEQNVVKKEVTEADKQKNDEINVDKAVEEITTANEEENEEKKEIQEVKKEKIDPVKIEVSSQRIPSGTSFDVKLNDTINSISSEIGNQFNTSLMSDIIINDNIVLPSGSVIRGTIGKVRKSGLFVREAKVLLVFDHVVTPIGKQVPIYAYISNNQNVDYAGFFVGGTSYGKAMKEDLQKSKDIIVNSTNWGVNTGKNYLSGVPVVLTAPVGAIGGTLGGGGYLIGKSVYNMFNKGKDVYLNKDTVLHVTLSRALDVPVN